MDAALACYMHNAVCPEGGHKAVERAHERWSVVAGDVCLVGAQPV